MQPPHGPVNPDIPPIPPIPPQYPPGQGWTPPLQVPLKRTLDLGSTYSTGFKIFKTRFASFMSIGAIAAVVLFLPLCILMVWWVNLTESWMNAGIPAGPPTTIQSAMIALTTGVYVFFGMLVNWWGILACCALANGELTEQPISAGEARRVGLSRLSSLIPVAALVGLAYTLLTWGTIVGFLAFANWVARTVNVDSATIATIVLVFGLLILSVVALIVTILLTVRWFVALPVMASEDTRIWPALSRSSQITQGSRGMIFLAMFIVNIAVSILSQVLTLPISFIVPHVVVSAGASTTIIVWSMMGVSCILAAFLVPVMPILSQVIYRDRLQWAHQ